MVTYYEDMTSIVNGVPTVIVKKESHDICLEFLSDKDKIWKSVHFNHVYYYDYDHEILRKIDEQEVIRILNRW